MDSQPGKKALRARLIEMRADIPARERGLIDARIAQRVLSSPVFGKADAILAYLSMGDEVETRAIIRSAWSSGKTVALPRCIPGTRAMAWHRIDSFGNLVKSSFGVEEPADDKATRVGPGDFEAPLALVPGLAFDANGFRIGYGGGFYDVFLADFAGATLGLCRECQLFEAGLPGLDAHDMPVQAVATENRLLEVRG